MCGKEQATPVSKSFAPTKSSLDAITRINDDRIINLDQGDPMMFETYWNQMGDKCTVEISGYEWMSYFADAGNLCWFLLPGLGDAIKRLHRTVGNAVTEDRYIVVGTGSSQLFQAALYALCPPDALRPVSVVSAAPYYSCYPQLTEFLRSSLYKWAGDAYAFEEEGPYIEVVCNPNNPDGIVREPVVNRDDGKVIHDLAYYWPQYTPITFPANHDIMLFTFSKCTGHAGSRIGWALVKDKAVAAKMVEYMTIATIGVSKEAQLRAAKIMQVITDSYLDLAPKDVELFFEHAKRAMADRWKRVREIVAKSEMFSLPKYPLEYCHFSSNYTMTNPGFAWFKCKDDIGDCSNLFRRHKILGRSGKFFGVDAKYCRLSMIADEESFNLFLRRLSAIVETNDVPSGL
ncbi:Alliinase, C-terminal [Dillenia turbinata]|uniref:Alliinase, C-terminal n=1 Tax=Dillenia turbinata TaxID=194707 RepID=A0AAN8Z6F0_9MAGN